RVLEARSVGGRQPVAGITRDLVASVWILRQELLERRILGDEAVARHLRWLARKLLGHVRIRASDLAECLQRLVMKIGIATLEHDGRMAFTYFSGRVLHTLLGEHTAREPRQSKRTTHQRETP